MYLLLNFMNQFIDIMCLIFKTDAFIKESEHLQRMVKTNNSKSAVCPDHNGKEHTALLLLWSEDTRVSVIVEENRL